MLHKPTSTVYQTSDVAVHQALQYKYQWYYDKWSYLNKTQVLWFTDLWGAAYWNRHKNGSVNKKKKKNEKLIVHWGSSGRVEDLVEDLEIQLVEEKAGERELFIS